LPDERIATAALWPTKPRKTEVKTVNETLKPVKPYAGVRTGKPACERCYGTKWVSFVGENGNDYSKPCPDCTKPPEPVPEADKT
jgi:hypothetical protein